MDFITITGLQIYAYHGVYEEEQKKGQNFYVNAKLYVDMEKAAYTDEVYDSVHYGEVCECMHAFLTQHTFRLLEKAVTETMKEVLLRFPLLKGMEMELCKPEAPIALPFENVSVTRSMFWNKTYIALGSNMGDSEGYVKNAIDAITNDTDFRKVRTSSLIITKPYGGVEQDDFVNGVLEAETLLQPLALLDRLHQYEQDAKRERLIHWGPRTLDLDILFYEDVILDTENLTIPHKDMKNRDFVLGPMCELSPYFRHPIYHITMEEMLDQLNKGKL